MPTRPTKPTLKKERRNWQARFLAALAESPSVTRAAQAAGVNRSHVYDARAADPKFAAQWDAAIEEALDKAEEELYRRAVSGVKKPVTVAGRQVYIQEYSDTLLIFLLKAHRPKYRETARSLNLSLTPDQLAGMSDDDLNRLIDSLARRA